HTKTPGIARRSAFSAASGRLRLGLAQGAIQCTEQGTEARRGQVLVDADAVQSAAAVDAQLDVGCSLGIGTGADGMFAVIHDLDGNRQGGGKRFQRALADTAPVMVLTAFGDFHVYCAGTVLLLQAMTFQTVRAVRLQVLGFDQMVALRDRKSGV